MSTAQISTDFSPCSCGTKGTQSSTWSPSPSSPEWLWAQHQHVFICSITAIMAKPESLWWKKPGSYGGDFPGWEEIISSCSPCPCAGPLSPQHRPSLPCFHIPASKFPIFPPQLNTINPLLVVTTVQFPAASPRTHGRKRRQTAATKEDSPAPINNLPATPWAHHPTSITVQSSSSVMYSHFPGRH